MNVIRLSGYQFTDVNKSHIFHRFRLNMVKKCFDKVKSCNFDTERQSCNVVLTYYCLSRDSPRNVGVDIQISKPAAAGWRGGGGG